MEETSWHSYGKVNNIGHSAVRDLFSDPVVIEEKIDGSQFSFGRFDGELRCRSKGQQLNVDAPEKMFTEAVASALERLPNLKEGWTYRAEYLKSPSHNTLKYGRIPKDHLMIFDISPTQEAYLPYEAKREEAHRIGYEVVPLLAEGVFTEVGPLRNLLERESVLGSVRIEGFVVKNYSRFTPDGKVLLGKYVSEAFREAHGVQWKVSNPTQGDIVQAIIAAHKTEARWVKAIGHLRDAGTLTSSPKDIGPLIKEVQSDVAAECEAPIKEALWAWAKDQILRSVIHGLPEWYKGRLLEQAFEESADKA